MVEVSNRDYLLCRDIYISTFFMILLYFLLSSLLKIISLDIRYLIYLFCMLVITNVGAKQKGKRFVYNVIALDIHEK